MNTAGQGERVRWHAPWSTLLLRMSLALGVAACGGSSTITTDQLRPLRTLNNAEPNAAQTSLDARMNALAEQLQHAGLNKGSIWHNGFVPSGSRETLRLEIPADTCATIVALASSGIRDVDATLYLPDGTQVAQDAQPDSHPTVQVCAQDEGRYFYYTLFAYEGAGAFLVASFLGERDSFERAAAIIGGRPGIASEAELSPEERAVQAFTESVQHRGFTAMKDPVRVALAQTQSVRVGIEVEVGHCYAVGAFVLDGIVDANVRVLDDTGAEVAFDSAASRDAATQFCAERAGSFTVEIVAATGQGNAVIAMYAASESDVGGNSGLWLGARSNEQLATRSLQEALRVDAIAAVEAGYATPTVRARGALQLGQAIEQPLSLKAGACTRVSVAGGEGTGLLHVDLVAALPEASAPRVRRLGEAVVEACLAAGLDAPASAIVVSRRGYGNYALTLASKASASQ